MASYRVPAIRFLPYVDLNAAALRFMQSDAVEFPSSLLLPLPLVAMLSARPGALPQEDSAQARPSDEYAARALAINGALSSGSLQGLDAAAASAVFAVRMPAATCAIPGADDIWRTGVRIIADATASHLDTRDLEHVWASIEASACAQRAKGGSMSVLQCWGLQTVTASRSPAPAPDAGLVRGPEDLAYGVRQPWEPPPAASRSRDTIGWHPRTACSKGLPVAYALLRLREQSIVLRAPKSQDAARGYPEEWAGWPMRRF
jgi:hypothetical protein